VLLSATFIIYLLDHYFRLHGSAARERSKNANGGDSYLPLVDAASHILAPEMAARTKAG